MMDCGSESEGGRGESEKLKRQLAASDWAAWYVTRQGEVRTAKDLMCSSLFSLTLGFLSP